MIILFNILLGIAFSFKDRFIITKDRVAPKVTEKLGSQKLFNSDGSPLDNDKRSSYQLKWFDYTAYEKIVDETYAGAVLDDFFQLRQLGFIYQPWVQFAEPPYNGKLVNIEVDSRDFRYGERLIPK